LPFFDPADATLCLAWVPSYSFGLSATYLGPGANLFIRPECHITLVWVPIYSFGLGAVVFIRPECHIIDLAWVPIYSQSLASRPFIPGKSAILSKVGQVCQSVIYPA